MDRDRTRDTEPDRAGSGAAEVEAFQMSDADDQMGGTGGATGARPGEASSQGRAGATGRSDGEGDRPAEAGEDAVTEESKESFPASDPPANY